MKPLVYLGANTGHQQGDVRGISSMSHLLISEKLKKSTLKVNFNLEITVSYPFIIYQIIYDVKHFNSKLSFQLEQIFNF